MQPGGRQAEEIFPGLSLREGGQALSCMLAGREQACRPSDHLNPGLSLCVHLTCRHIIVLSVNITDVPSLRETRRYQVCLASS